MGACMIASGLHPDRMPDAGSGRTDGERAFAPRLAARTAPALARVGDDDIKRVPFESRGDSTPIELFLEGVRVWESGIRRLLSDKAVSED